MSALKPVQKPPEDEMTETNGTITRHYAMMRAKRLRSIAQSMDGGADYSTLKDDGPESLAQQLRQAAFVIEMTAPIEIPEPKHEP